VHQRGMGTIRIIIAMVIAGLIVYGVIYYGPDIWRRIQGGSGALSPTEVRTHASLYLGKEITVEGYWMEYVMSAGVMSDEIPAQSVAGLLGTYGGTGLISGGKYRITGILKTVPDTLNFPWSGLKNVYGISVYLEVTKVEPM